MVAANRDEFHARPTAPAGPWAEDPRVLGGGDLEAGGSWLGVRRDGRFAAVTNVREPGAPKGVRSRGLLVKEFLLGEADTGSFAAGIRDGDHSGYNLLLGDGASLWYRSNRDGGARELAPGVYGLSNHLLDTPWPKLVIAKARFLMALEALPTPGPCSSCWGTGDRPGPGPAPHRADPGVGTEAVSHLRGGRGRTRTRASTVLIRDREGRLDLEERGFAAGGEPAGRVHLGGNTWAPVTCGLGIQSGGTVFQARPAARDPEETQPRPHDRG